MQKDLVFFKKEGEEGVTIQTGESSKALYDLQSLLERVAQAKSL